MLVDLYNSERNLALADEAYFVIFNMLFDAG